MRIRSSLALTVGAVSIIACGPSTAPTDASDTPRVDTATDRPVVDASPMDSALEASIDAADGSIDAVLDAPGEVVTGSDVTDVVDAGSPDITEDVAVDAALDVPIVPQCDATTTVRVAGADFALAGGDSHAALVWVEQPSRALRVAFVEADATVRGIQTITDATFPAQPRIARTASGWAVAWNDGASVRYRRLDPMLAPIGSAAPVRTATGTDYRPQISASGDDLAIAWLASTSSDLELWITNVSSTDAIASPTRITTASSDMSVTSNGAASWGVLFPDRAGGATSAGTLVTYGASSGLGTPVVLAPIGLTQRIAWTGGNYLAASLFGSEEYVETYTSSAARTSQRHFTFATPTAPSGAAAYSPISSVFGSYAQVICLQRPTGGTSFLDIGWFAADGSTARAEGPVIDIPDPNCAEPAIAAMDADHAVVGWADVAVSDHDLTLRVLCR